MEDRNQDACSNESDNDAANQTKLAQAEQACQKPTNECTDETYYDITNDPIAAAAHHAAGEEACNQTDHQPENNAERIECESQSENDRYECHTEHVLSVAGL
jgi:hypothetical protein